MQRQRGLWLRGARERFEADIEPLLPLVSKPHQYVGNELNVCLKDHAEVSAHFALAYPDTYSIGMSHQGLKILYHLLNRRSDVVAERVYAPWVDMESLMRKRGIPLFSLESHLPVAAFDVLGFTLQHELNFTNVLNMLDLAGIPLHSKERDEGHPLVLAGGCCASNPEPLAEFIDAFVIGDGEEVVEEIADVVIRGKESGWSRQQILVHLAGLEGIYVPLFYRPQYDVAGRFRTLLVEQQGLPTAIVARIVAELKPEYYPSRPLVPLTEIAHDRLSIEIMRGCTRGCRYCHAGMVYRPVREKPPQDVVTEAVNGIDHSGWDEVSLVSLSSSDYGPLAEVVAELNQRLAHKRVALALPSLRPDAFTESLALSLQQVRKTGLTFAPESGTVRLRKVINKDFREENLLRSLQIAFDNGWESVKLYFMIGLPMETWDDLTAIVDLCRTIVRKIKMRGRREIHISISPFTPKPHTPFQWAGQDSVDVLEKKIHFLKSRLARRGVRVSWRDPRVSFLEAVFARGDRKLGRALEAAWRSGCRFDSWTEQFDSSRWQKAFVETGIDPQRYVQERSSDDPLPWDHINYGVRHQYLARERDRARQEKGTPDCRKRGCQRCGIHQGPAQRKPTAPAPQPQDSGSNVAYGRKKKRSVRGRPQIARTRLRVQYAKERPLRFLSHLDMIRLLERTIRRADLPIDYSEGFHPHPRIAFGPPLAVGLTSQAEYMDLQFAKPLVGDLAFRMKRELPKGLRILHTRAIFRKTEALSAAINVADYRADVSGVKHIRDLEKTLQELLSAERLPVQRSTPKETKTIDISAHLLDLRVERPREAILLLMRLRTGPQGHIRPREVLELALRLPKEHLVTIPVERTAQYIEIDSQLLSPLDVI
jgi:radical SAM family uncharacterized protein/radical SAM-linked protein